MYLEISDPMDYNAALYIRLSKEDESEGPSQSVQNQESLLREFVQRHRLSVYDTYVDATPIIGLNQEVLKNEPTLVWSYFLLFIRQISRGCETWAKS